MRRRGKQCRQQQLAPRAAKCAFGALLAEPGRMRACVMEAPLEVKIFTNLWQVKHSDSSFNV